MHPMTSERWADLYVTNRKIVLFAFIGSYRVKLCYIRVISRYFIQTDAVFSNKYHDLYGKDSHTRIVSSEKDKNSIAAIFIG